MEQDKSFLQMLFKHFCLLIYVHYFIHKKLTILFHVQTNKQRPQKESFKFKFKFFFILFLPDQNLLVFFLF